MLDSRANSRGWEAVGQGERPQSVVSRPTAAAAAASKNLLERRIIGPQARPTESKT